MSFGVTSRLRFHRIALTLAVVALAGTIGATATQAAKPPAVNPIFTYNKPDREQHLYDCAKKEGSVTLYTSSSATDGTLKPAFEAAYPGVKLNTYVATAALAPRLRQEEDAGQHNFDVYNDAMGTMGRTSKYFQPIWSPYMAKVQSDLQGTYFLASNGYLFPGLYYNPNLISANDVPKTWQDLLKPQYTGKIYMGTDPSAAVVTGMLQTLYGKDYYVKLSKQVRVQNTSGRGIADQVIAGTIPMGIEMSSSYYKTNYLNQGAPLRLQVLQPMYGNFQASSISKFAPHPCAAMLLVDWYLNTSSHGAQPVFDTLGNASPLKNRPTLPFDVAGQPPVSSWKIIYGTSSSLYRKLGYKAWYQAYAFWSRNYLKYFINGG